MNSFGMLDDQAASYHELRRDKRYAATPSRSRSTVESTRSELVAGRLSCRTVIPAMPRTPSPAAPRDGASDSPGQGRAIRVDRRERSPAVRRSVADFGALRRAVMARRAGRGAGRPRCRVLVAAHLRTARRAWRPARAASPNSTSTICSTIRRGAAPCRRWRRQSGDRADLARQRRLQLPVLAAAAIRSITLDHRQPAIAAMPGSPGISSQRIGFFGNLGSPAAYTPAPARRDDPLDRALTSSADPPWHARARLSDRRTAQPDLSLDRDLARSSLNAAYEFNNLRLRYGLKF